MIYVYLCSKSLFCLIIAVIIGKQHFFDDYELKKTFFYKSMEQ